MASVPLLRVNPRASLRLLETLIRTAPRVSLYGTSTTPGLSHVPRSNHRFHSSVAGRHGVIVKFYHPEVQSCLKQLCGANFETIFRKRKLGQKLREPKFSFMTEAQLEESIRESEEKAQFLLQMPPVLPPREPIEKILSFEPYIQGYDPDNSTVILTDITLNGNDRDRLVVARDPDGTLRHANWEERSKVNNAYFPTPGRKHEPPKLFNDKSLLQAVLDRASPSDNTYEFVLDRACLQFEPDDPQYIDVVEFTYSSIDKKQHYDYLSSTRHYGPMVFYLVRTRQLDNLLIHYIKSERISPNAALLVSLYHLIFEKSGSRQSTRPASGQESQDQESFDIAKVRSYIELDAIKKSELELALNWYLDTISKQQELTQGLQRSHGA